MRCVLILLIVIAVIALIVIGAIAVRRDCELTRIARILIERDPDSNARITLSVRSKGLVALACAVNCELDEESVRRIEDEREKQDSQESLAALSHDIRTPLAGAKGYLQLAMQEENEDARAQYLKAAASRLDSMRDLVDGLLDYAKANDEVFPLELEEIDIVSALSDALMGLFPRFKEREWEPKIEVRGEGLFVLADRGSLGRILSNVLSNTLRHGSSAPLILIEGDGNMTRVVVSNKVPDPTAIDPELLFNRFYKAGTSRGSDGSGLGLAVVARLCERMGGSAVAKVDGELLELAISLPASQGRESARLSC